jgi:shikimate dehydrogenase
MSVKTPQTLGPVYKFGLLGDGIGRSLSPGLHEILGELTDRTVTYPVFDRSASFTSEIPEFLNGCSEDGHVGINVTHPFKESICEHIESDSMVEAIGAANTVCFLSDGRRIGHNTDCTGLQSALAPFRPANGFGAVAQLGAGGFGKAAAFALAELGVPELRLFDTVPRRAQELADRVTRHASHTGLHPVICDTADDACRGASGIVNCSPIGMHHHPGNPVRQDHLRSATWVFDAVYVPMKTEFLRMAEQAGLVAVSGAELFFWQAIHAFQHFTDSVLCLETIAEARQRIWPEVLRRSESGE